MACDYWSFSVSIKSGEHVRSLMNAKPSKFIIANDEKLGEYIEEMRARYGSKTWYSKATAHTAEFPMPKLNIADPTLSANYFHVGQKYVSAKLRSIMQLPDDSVQYLDVDLSDCPVSVQAMDYKVMNPLTSAIAYFMEKPADYMARIPPGTGEFQGIWFDLPQRDGTLKKEWIITGPHAPLLTVDFIDGFKPPAPLFLSQGQLIATDELAERVLRSGITDVAFYDITNDGTQTDLRWKTLA
jgi:hypothetical protein